MKICCWVMLMAAPLLFAADDPDRIGNIEAELERMNRALGVLQDTVAAQQKTIADLQQGHTTVGMIVPYAGNIDADRLKLESAGWLLCDGSDRPLNDEYRALFAIIHNDFGGDGTTKFKLPDLREKDPVGAGGGYVRGQPYGTATHKLIGSELPGHVHKTEAHTHQWADLAPVASGVNVLTVTSPASAPEGLKSFDSHGESAIVHGSRVLGPVQYFTTIATPKTTDTTWQDNAVAFPVVPPSLAVNFLIRYK